MGGQTGATLAMPEQISAGDRIHRREAQQSSEPICAADSAELKAGAVLAVGREAKRIAKTLLKITFE